MYSTPRFKNQRAQTTAYFPVRRGMARKPGILKWLTECLFYDRVLVLVSLNHFTFHERHYCLCSKKVRATAAARRPADFRTRYFTAVRAALDIKRRRYTFPDRRKSLMNRITWTTKCISYQRDPCQINK